MAVPAGMTETALLSPSLLAGTGLGGTGAAALTAAGIPISAGTGLSAMGNVAANALLPTGLANAIPSIPNNIPGNPGVTQPINPSTGLPNNVTTPPVTTPPTNTPPTPDSTSTTPPTTPKPGDAGFQWPTDPAGWLKLFGPALGGLLLGAESYLNKGDEQPQDPFTRDYARGVLSNPRASAGAMSGLMNKKYY
jgi:hypothetical protein